MQNREIATVVCLSRFRAPLAAAAAATLVALLASPSNSLAATTYYWDPGLVHSGTGSDGTGTWNTSATNWYPGSGIADVVWPNTTAYDASFGAGGSTASTVTLGTAITTGGVIFKAGPSYTLTSNTLSVGADGITLTNATAAQTINSAIALTSNQIWTNSTAGKLTVGGPISGGFGLTINGSGNLSLSGYSTYTGGTIINSGTVTANYTGASGDPSAITFGKGDITVNSGGNVVSNANFSVSGGNTTTRTINLTGGTWTINSTISSGAEYIKTLNFTGGTLTDNKDFIRVVSGGSTITSNASTVTSTISKNIDLTYGNLTLNVAQGMTSSGQDLAIAGGITENTGVTQVARSITKNGAGTLFIGGGSGYTGGTTLAAGTILVGATNALGTTGTISTSDNTTLASANTSTQYTLSNAIAVTGTVNIQNGFSLTGAISGNSAAKLNFNGTGSTALFVTGDLSKYAGSINYVDAANGNNLNFTGTTAVSQDASAIAFNLSGAGSSTANYRAIQIGTGPSSTFKMGSLAGTGGVIGTSGATALTLQVGALNTDTTFGGVLSNLPYTGLPTTGSSLALVKVGSGSLSLTGANTYAAGTTISAGTLLAANTTAGQSSTGTGGVALNAGTLSSLGGATSYIAGIVTGGSSAHAITAGGGTTTVGGMAANIGTLAVGGLALNGNSTLYFDIASAASHDQINDSGALGATGTVNIVVPTTLRMSMAQVIKLIGFGNNSSLLSNYVLNNGVTPTGYSLSINTASKELDLNITAVPEPAMAATLVIGAFGLLGGRRRRSR